MKTKLIVLGALILMSVSQAYALPVLPDLYTAHLPVAGESDFVRSGDTAHVDWIVMKKDQLPDLSAYSFVFASNAGDLASFNDSEYFYFYQISNTTDDVIEVLQLNISPSSIETVGFIMNLDLDLSPFFHDVAYFGNLAGESESATLGPINPGIPAGTQNGARFVPTGGNPYVSWMFETPSYLAPNQESTILFLTSNYAPHYNPGIMGAGWPALNGILPTPPFPSQIPEPVSMGLIGLSILGLFIKKRIK